MGLENAGMLTDATHTKANAHQADQDKLIQNPKQAHGEYKVMTQAKGTISEAGKFWQGMHDGMHEFVDETGQSLSVAGDYYGKALTGKVNLGTNVKEFGNAIGSSIGQALGTAGDYYFSRVPKGQANLGKDIGEARKAAADYCNSLDTEQKGHFVGNQVVPLLVPGAVGIVAKEVQGANLISKAGEAITAFRGPQLVPAYAGGFSPARAIAAANIGQITGKETRLTSPGMLLMSRPKGELGEKKPRDSNNPQNELRAIFVPTREDIKSLLEALRELAKEYPGAHRGMTLNPTAQLANDFEIERAVSYFAENTPHGYDYRIDGGPLKLAGSRKSNGSLELYVQTSSDIAPLYRDFIGKANALLKKRGFRSSP